MADGGVCWPSDLELKLNLNAIKKCDQFVVNIIDSASQVALYKFKSETQAWVSVLMMFFSIVSLEADVFDKLILWICFW